MLIIVTFLGPEFGYTNLVGFNNISDENAFLKISF